MKIPSNKIKDVISFFNDELKTIYSPEEIATFVSYCFEFFLKIKRIDLRSRENETMSESELLKFNFAIKDLKKERPIQYILGEADFYGMKFLVNEHVLIPRPETEELVDFIVKENQEARSKKQDSREKNQELIILDIGTGSGCIPIALKKNLPAANVSAVDISEEALTVARKNAILNNTDVIFFNDNALAPDLKKYKKESVDILVSNPPYIRFSEKGEMKKNVLDHEPHLALFVNHEDPLLFYAAIADLGKVILKNGGKIYFEINEAFGPETKQLLENKGFKNVTLCSDITGKNRILRGTHTP